MRYIREKRTLLITKRHKTMKNKEKSENVEIRLKEHFKEIPNLPLQKASNLVVSSTFVRYIL